MNGEQPLQTVASIVQPAAFRTNICNVAHERKHHELIACIRLVEQHVLQLAKSRACARRLGSRCL